MKMQKGAEDVDGATEDGKRAVALVSFLWNGGKAERRDTTGRVQSQQGNMFFQTQEL